MSTALQLFAALGLLVGVAAALLWVVEAVAKVIGGRNTWLVFLVAIPFAVSLAVTVLSWEKLVWWERLAYSLSGPLVAVALLFAAFAAFNPGDAALFLWALVQSGWRICMQRIRGRQRDA